MQDFSQDPILLFVIGGIIFLLTFKVFEIFLPFIIVSLQVRRARIQRKREFKENIESGALGEPRAIRELTKEESAILRRYQTGVYVWTRNNYVSTIIFLFPLLLLFLGFKFDLFVNVGYLLILGIILSILAFFVVWAFKEEKLYKDTISPVFGISGVLVKRSLISNRGDVYTGAFVIRGIKFESDENPQVEGLWDSLKDGDRLSIEYSPFTKHIWKIEKV